MVVKKFNIRKDDDMKNFILILSLFLFIASVNPADSATWTVNNLADFQARLTEAQNNGQNDTINVSAGIYNVVATLTYQPVEARTLTIQGASAATTILDGGDSVPIMSVNTTAGGVNANITIRGLTFQNGDNGAGDGGGVYTEVGDATITIENCSFLNNVATGAGGCFFATTEDDGTVIFRNNTVSGTNSSGGSGAAVRINARQEGTVQFENNTIGGTNSAGASGGAVYINTTIGTLNILNNSISGTNTTTNVGGAIYANATGGTLNILNNSITGNNSAEGSGGALYANTSSDGTLIISGNTIGGTNTAGTRGGGIYANTASNATMTISNNTISGANTASSIDGGGIYANTGSDSTSTFSGNTIFGNNNASTTGGGAHINGGSGSTITVDNNTISGTNSAPSGGGIRVNAPFEGILYFVNNTVTGNSASNNGGGVYIPSSGTANVYNNIIRDNTVTGPGIAGDDIYLDTSPGFQTNLFNNILGPASDFITANSEDLVITDITLYSQGNNSTADPMLGPLQNNGGPTFTRALPEGSAAINAGDNTIVALLGISTDQRGYPRIVNAVVDIGAYEFGSSLAIPALTDWGIIVFLTLAGFGSVYFLRRQRGTGN